MTDNATKVEAMCYAARFPGTAGYGAIVVDDEHKKDTAKSVAAWMRKGATIERVTRDQAVAGMTEYLKAKGRIK